jgi:hypothetical protein
MKRFRLCLAALAIAVFLTTASGCSHSSADDRSSLEQQKKDVMGAPPPASAQTQIAADRARAAQQMRQGLANQQQTGKP